MTPIFYSKYLNLYRGVKDNLLQMKATLSLWIDAPSMWLYNSNGKGIWWWGAVKGLTSTLPHTLHYHFSGLAERGAFSTGADSPPHVMWRSPLPQNPKTDTRVHITIPSL